MKYKTDTELVDEFCKINNLYDGLEDRCDKMIARIRARETIDCSRYILRQRVKELIEIIFEKIEKVFRRAIR